jgi:LPXTG-motif cell wall-anchored protein
MTNEQKGMAALGAIIAIGAGFFVAKRRRASGLRTWQCQCGKTYEVQGLDRHRVYSVPGEGPVLGRECVQCGATLPAGHG